MKNLDALFKDVLHKSPIHNTHLSAEDEEIGDALIEDASIDPEAELENFRQRWQNEIQEQKRESREASVDPRSSKGYH